MRTSQSATELKWADRVRAWRASGEKAPDFARGRGFEASTLRYWASRLERGGSPGFLKLVPRGAAPSADVVAAEAAVRSSEVVVEVGAARVRVSSGFDARLLGEVVKALGGGTR